MKPWRAGLGQSYVVGVGGDALGGTSLRGALEMVWKDSRGGCDWGDGGR